jgi:hypothetical protein
LHGFCSQRAEALWAAYARAGNRWIEKTAGQKNRWTQFSPKPLFALHKRGAMLLAFRQAPLCVLEAHYAGLVAVAQSSNDEAALTRFSAVSWGSTGQEHGQSQT